MSNPPKYHQSKISQAMQRGESIPAWRPPEVRSAIGLPDGELSPTRHAKSIVVAREIAARCARAGKPLDEQQIEILRHALSLEVIS